LFGAVALAFSFSASSFSFSASLACLLIRDQITLNRGADAGHVTGSVSLGPDVVYVFHDLKREPSPVCLLFFNLSEQAFVFTAFLVKYFGAEQSAQTDKNFGVAVEALYRFE
jgi:hypothetical protein